MSEPPAPSPPPDVLRRPIRARETRWAHAIAATLTRRGVQPNHISILSVVAALGGAAAFVGAGQTDRTAARAALLLLAGLCIQARLQCNLFDGLVAVEGGRRTKTGEIYNELPDRFADALFLAAAGYATRWTGWEHDLGWAAATLAAIVAYVRALGGQLGASQQFCGPMAKQHRMFTLTLACVASAAEVFIGWPTRAMTLALGLIVLGAGVTAARRTVRVARELEAR